MDQAAHQRDTTISEDLSWSGDGGAALDACLSALNVARCLTMTALLNLPSIQDQTAFNLDRWDVLCADKRFAGWEGRFETDRFGGIIMHYYAEFAHGDRQVDIASLLRHFLPKGKATVECPISTSEGVKVADVAWISNKRLKQVGGRAVLKGAPEICVEVLSKKNTKQEIEEKRRLYFDAGAKEVWVCERNGIMHFFLTSSPAADSGVSTLCPEMPKRLK